MGASAGTPYRVGRSFPGIERFRRSRPECHYVIIIYRQRRAYVFKMFFFPPLNTYVGVLKVRRCRGFSFARDAA